ncbi:uncharacterized protein [Phaseolus vulgaris]|uniref:uncharacterized protein isoform X5 n=1 Tax=Phaseolus vulgaris TaxID=3885 RepID=UPI0035CC0F95
MELASTFAPPQNRLSTKKCRGFSDLSYKQQMKILKQRIGSIVQVDASVGEHHASLYLLHSTKYSLHETTDNVLSLVFILH